MKFHLFCLLIMKSVTQIVYYIKKLSAAINKLKALMIIINSYTKYFSICATLMAFQKTMFRVFYCK